MKKIVTFYLNTILKSSKYNSPNPVNNMDLLFPDFAAVFKKCVVQYQKTYPKQHIAFTETYRSNSLQEKYFNEGASKIKKNGMHHYGIAGDSIFIIDGKRSYKGDINLLRKIYKENGLTILGMWDPLHVQYIPVAQQSELRKLVDEALSKQKSPAIIANIDATKQKIKTLSDSNRRATLDIKITATKPGYSEIIIYLNGIWVQTTTSSSTVIIDDIVPGDIIDISCTSLGHVAINLSGVNADQQSMKFIPPSGFDSFNIQ